MRTSIGRLTLRGAQRLAATTRPARAAASTASPNFTSRDLCTGSAVSADAKRKSEEPAASKDPERITVVNALPDEAAPAVEVLTEDTGASSVEIPVAPAISGEAGTAVDAGVDAEVNAGRDTEAAGAAGAPSTHDPAELLDQLKELMDRNAVRSALWHFGNALRMEGAPAVDAAVMKFILPILGRQAWADTAAQTLTLALDRGYSIGTSAFNCGLHAVARSGNADDISSILNRMWALTTDCNPNATSYNYLIAAHIYSGKVDEAFTVLNEMKKHLIYPTFATYHALITGCLRRRDPRRAYQTLIAVEKQRFDISAMTVAQVLVACANNDDYDPVIHLLSKFEESLPRYGSELHRIAEFRGLYRLINTERTTKEERDSMRGDPKPEIGAISAVLHCAFRGGRVDIASRAWLLLQEHYPHYEIPLPLWYCMIGAYAGSGDFARAIDIVGVMREKGLKPSMRDLELALIRPLAYDVDAIDEQFYRLCDRAGGKGGDNTQVSASGTEPATASEASEDVAKVLDNEGPVAPSEENDEDPAATDLSIPPNADDQTTLTAADSSDVAVEAAEDVEEKKTGSLADALFKADSTASEVLSPLHFEPKSVGIEELNCIIGACSASQDLDRAFQTYDEVESRFGLQRNIETYNALLEGCVQTRRLSGGLRVLAEIENVGLRISGHTVHLAARLMLRAGQLEDLLRMLQKAHKQGDTIPLQTYQMVLRQFTRLENLSPAIDVLKLGEEAGHDFRALTGRFDFNGVKKLRFAAYGEEMPRGVGDAGEDGEAIVSPGNTESGDTAHAIGDDVEFEDDDRKDKQ